MQCIDFARTDAAIVVGVVPATEQIADLVVTLGVTEFLCFQLRYDTIR